MTFARVLWLLIFAAATAACSGNLGGGQSTLPGMPQNGTNANGQQMAPPPPTPTPNSASNVATVGDTLTPQALPAINGWGGSITFAKPTAAPSASPNPKVSGTPADVSAASSVSVGITASVVEPTDAPHFGSASKKRAKRDPNAISALLFVSLLSTSDLTLAQYPKIAFDVPREVAATHRDDVYALALYDPEQKEKSYRLGVAERDLSSPMPGSMPAPVATLVPTPGPPTPFGMPPNGPAALTPPPVGAQMGGDSLPPEYIAFKATAAVLKLKSNRPVVFALYAVAPPPTPAPSLTPPGSAPASAAPSASSLPSPLGLPSPSSVPSASSLPAPTAKPIDTR
jgi:hypothetical protein